MPLFNNNLDSEPEFVKDPSMFAEPFVSDHAFGRSPPSLPSNIYPRNRYLIASPSTRQQAHKLRLFTDESDAVGHPYASLLCRSSPEPIVPQMKLRLVGDFASDASSRHSQASEYQCRGIDEDITSSAQRCSVVSSQRATLPLPYDQNAPTQHHNIPHALVPGRIPRLSTQYPGAARADSTESSPQPPLQPQASTAPAWNSQWVPDPAW